MTKLVHHDQTGFIKNRLASDNVRRLLHILDFAPDILTPCAAVSLDAEKAFEQTRLGLFMGCTGHNGTGS